MAVVMLCGIGAFSEIEAYAKEGDDTTTAQLYQELEQQFGDAEWALKKAVMKKYADTGRLTIVLDPGHDSTHHGATRRGLLEEELTLKIAKYCKEELERYQGVDVYLTRTASACPNPGSTSTMDNYYRVAWAAGIGADAYVSLHLNVADRSSVSGVEVYAQNTAYRPDLSSTSKSLSWNIANELQGLGLSNGGVKTRNSTDGIRYPDGTIADYYSVNHNSKLFGFPGIIVEHAYLTNATDIQRFLGNENGLKQLGIADATGIAKYYGLVQEDYSVVFDATYYREHYADLQAAYGNDENALFMHFIQYGLPEGRVASPTFDIAYYKKNNPDVAQCYGNDLGKICTHFVKYGMKEGRRASGSFDVKSYQLQYADLRQAYGDDLSKYYQHYARFGYKEGRKGTGCTKRNGYVTGYKGVDYSSIYDCEYYLAKNADVRQAFGTNDDISVLKHFVTYGMKEGRQASAGFDVHSYRRQYSDLRNIYGKDLAEYYLHYINWGKKEGRQGTGCASLQGATTIYRGQNYAAVYDYTYYVAHNPDVRQVFGEDEQAVLEHFVTYGMKEGRQASAGFNVQFYRNQYRDLQSAFGNDWKAYYVHYLNYGLQEGRIGR